MQSQKLNSFYIKEFIVHNIISLILFSQFCDLDLKSSAVAHYNFI